MVDRDKLKSKAVELGKSATSKVKSELDNQTTTSASSGNGNGNKRILRVQYKDEISKWHVAGPTAGYGTFDTKKEAVKVANKIYDGEGNYNTGDAEYTQVQIHTREGGVNTNQSFGTRPQDVTDNTQQNQSSNQTGFGGLFGTSQSADSKERGGFPFMGEPQEESEQPTNPFMGGQQDNQQESGPSLPFMGEPQDDDRDMGHPIFGPQDDDREMTHPFMQESDDDEPRRFF